jgi:two-component system response regulator DevR
MYPMHRSVEGGVRPIRFLERVMRIFLVDDSVLIRERMRRMLQDVEGIEIAGETGDAHEAIGVIPRVRPDVILLDIHLLGGSGIDVLNALKKDGHGHGPVVIVLTNYAYPQYRDKCLQAGADYFFVKSTEFDMVIPTLQQIRQKAGPSASQSSGGRTSSPA